MKTKPILLCSLSFSLLFLLSLSFASCASGNKDGEKAKADYQQSLQDSIKSIQAEIESANQSLESLRDSINQSLLNFTTVANPREVGSYIILTSAQKRYPLSATGVAARLDESGVFQIIAALSGKAFNQIAVSADGQCIESDVVPRDQGLNYQTDQLTTVMFSGRVTDSIASLIASAPDQVTLSYRQAREVKSLKLSPADKEMISRTYQLYKQRCQLSLLEHKIPLLHQKINLIRVHLDNKEIAPSDSTQSK
ncbi:MAG: hypothetical protein ACI4AK_07025 [Lepagella sp.]